ncbi:MAG TPA: signal recognition particle-docking protein FtsY [Nitrososphaera sp.]|jgi:fused signal recognition particle receptor
MFDKLKKAFSSAAKGIGQKEITEKVLDDSLFDLQMSLLESDVAQEAVDSLSAKLKKELLGLKLEKGEDAGKIIHSKLQNAVAEVFASAGKFGLAEKIRAKRDAKAGPFVIVFLGINGTGKTTTVAKVANLLRKDGFTVVVAAGDTHRAGAIEQLTQHADRLSLKVIAQRYGADPSAVGRDAVEHARKNYIDVVLVDTAGRMQTSKNLMDEMGKIVRVVKPDAKLFIGDALAGNDTINQAREFYQYTNFDGAILTKIDADAKGGAAISIAYITSKPVVYVGVGQGYDDIIPFEPDKFIESLFGTAAEVKVEDLMSSPRISKTAFDETKDDIEIKPVESVPLEQEKTPSGPPVVPAASPVIIAPKRQEKPERPELEPLAKPPVQVLLPAEKQSEKAKDITPPPKPKETPKPEPVVKMESGESPAQKPLDESKEKKGRFGGLFKKKSDEERKKEEEQRRKAEEERSRDEAERARLEEEEIKNKEKEKDEKKKRKEDKDTEEDKVVYLTDEDIEDLLK